MFNLTFQYDFVHVGSPGLMHVAFHMILCCVMTSCIIMFTAIE
uniref:Uncharacterized protein n=1 Tax=Anguilla anguilla TaxID=7936 RepID=A0A0E9S7H1_ANGAN